MPLTELTTNLPKLPDSMQYYKGSQEKAMPDITYERNMQDPAYQEWIFADGQYIGEIYGGVLEGFQLRKVKEIQLAAGAAAVDLETIAYFDTVCDAKCFVNQAGRL
jgi:hypothetical protein